MGRMRWLIGSMALFVIVFAMSAQAGKVEWDFSTATLTDGGAPVKPSVATLGGTMEDWIMDGNPNNYDPSVSQAVDFSEGFLHFLDDSTVSGNVSLRTSSNTAVRDEYKLKGPGSQLWLICDHQMIKYGHRANLSAGTVDRTRCQVFWLSFLTSSGVGLGLQFNAGNFNTEDYMFFTAIGNSDESQAEFIADGRLIEDYGAEPNLDRRTVTLRVTENADSASVTIDVRFDKGAYKTIDAAYTGAIANYPGGNIEGDQNVLAVIGNNSGSGAMEFNMYRLTFTNDDPDGGTPVENWPLFE